jgi:CheY-like chemotaxis protein
MPSHATCPRIVLVDDEEFTHEMVDLALRESLTDYTLVKFLNRDEAWQELLREPPDLLITDMLSTNVPGRTEYFGMSGGELLQRLAERRVNYPILVVSGSFSISGWEAYAKHFARPHLNVSFLTKPYTMDLFRLAVRNCLGSGEGFVA